MYIIMKFLHYLLFIINITKVEVYFIQNQYKPICDNCKFFIPNKNECRKFGDVNIITGKYSYESAISVRKRINVENMRFYLKKIIFITIPYYFLLENGKLIFILSYNFSLLWYIFTK
jgi:hypothetical protein